MALQRRMQTVHSESYIGGRKMNGDALARGARFATFGPAEKVSQEKWDAIWADDADDVEVIKDKEPKNENSKQKSRR